MEQADHSIIATSLEATVFIVVGLLVGTMTDACSGVTILLLIVGNRNSAQIMSSTHNNHIIFVVGKYLS